MLSRMPRRLMSWLFAASVLAACADNPTLNSQVGAPSGGTGPVTGAAGSSTGSSNTGGSAPTPPTTGGSVMIGVPGAAGGGGGPGACSNLECRRATCAAGVTTTLSGTVFEPAGKLPLYNVVVYIPNGEVPALSPGATCDRCGAGILNPVASALTDTQGRFVLQDVPTGADVPLVIQIGKWRRQVTIPSVAACADTPVDPSLTHLPRNQSEGDIPLIAITTGGADTMECLPRRLGIEDAEFTTGDGTGRIHLYSGHDNPQGNPQPDIATKAFDPSLNAGATLPRSTTLWNTVDALARYDIVILSCEGATIPDEKPPAARQALYDYASRGGRVFASHWHHIWFSGGPDPVPEVGTWNNRTEPTNPSVGSINTGFPKGQALADWLVFVRASTTPGEIAIIEPRDNVQAVNEMYATEWITTQNTNVNAGNSAAVQYLSFNTPLDVAPELQCGREVFTDLHVSRASTAADLMAAGNDTPGNAFPTGCAVRDLSAQEKAVAFMLFDLSSCIQNDEDPPIPPPE